MKFPNTFKFPDDSSLLELTLKNDVYKYFQISKPQYKPPPLPPKDQIAIQSVWSASVYTMHLQFREYHNNIDITVTARFLNIISHPNGISASFISLIQMKWQYFLSKQQFHFCCEEVRWERQVLASNSLTQLYFLHQSVAYKYKPSIKTLHAVVILKWNKLDRCLW